MHDDQDDPRAERPAPHALEARTTDIDEQELIPLLQNIIQAAKQNQPTDRAQNQLLHTIQRARQEILTLRRDCLKLKRDDGVRKEADRSYLSQESYLGTAQLNTTKQRARVTLTFWLLGTIMLLAGGVLGIPALFGGWIGGQWGWAYSVCGLGAVVALLPTMPNDQNLIRCLVVLFVLIMGPVTLVLGLASALSLTNVLCIFSNAVSCNAIGAAEGLAALSTLFHTFPIARILRARSKANRVPISHAWKVSKKKFGRELTVILFPICAPIAWVLAQPPDSFQLSPRKSLEYLWSFLRQYLFTLGFIYLTANIIVSVLASAPPAHVWGFSASCFFLFVLTLKPMRTCVMLYLGGLDTRDEASAAAVISGILGRIPVSKALHMAKNSFSGIPYDSIDVDDFKRNHEAKDGERTALRERSVSMQLGQIDAFVSHSWHDPPIEKFEALTVWAKKFEKKHGRPPILWVDKACIDQGNIEESLACLPIYLSGCKNLLVLGGPTYTQRLWCVMEIFTFLFMGGTLSRTIFMPLASRSGAESDLKEVSAPQLSSYASTELISEFLEFDADRCECFVASERERLLSVIEFGFVSISRFNYAVRGLFAQAVDHQGSSFISEVSAAKSFFGSFLHRRNRGSAVAPRQAMPTSVESEPLRVISVT